MAIINKRIDKLEQENVFLRQQLDSLSPKTLDKTTYNYSIDQKQMIINDINDAKKVVDKLYSCLKLSREEIISRKNDILTMLSSVGFDDKYLSNGFDKDYYFIKDHISKIQQAIVNAEKKL